MADLKMDSNKRLLALTTPLGKDVLLVDQIRGTEQLSSLFHFSLQLVSEQKDIDFSKIVGESATLSIEQPGGSQRYWNGIISRFTQIASNDTYFRYEAEMVPWLWYLQYTEDIRIFQNKSVPKIVEDVFSGRGFTEVKLALSATYNPRPYCVQYRESDFAFVSRLLEEEGIFYYFEQQKDKHTLVLVDAGTTVKACAVKATLPYRPNAGNTEGDDISLWSCSLTIVPGKISLRDYDFEQPSTDLTADSPSVATHAKKSALDFYDYQPGRYTTVTNGEQYAKGLMQGHEARQQQIEGEGTCRTLAAGYSFTLSDHFRKDYNTDYLILEVHHTAANNLPWIEQTAHYSNRFACQANTLPYRPPFTTAKPVIHGVQTAVVVGPANEEIYTDKYGRIKVQFRWDRLGKNDDKSSCWIRVSQGWAGLSWGSMHIPRVGQEVLVEFLEGDPDQPIITGRVYNAEKMPPYELPANNTQSGIKSRSTPNGGADNFNELRFEDKKGSEDVYFQAEKDFHRVVKNDDDLQVQHDRTETIKNNRTITVSEGNASYTISKGTRTVTVEGDDSHEVKTGNRTVTVATGNDTCQVKKGNRSVTVALGNDELTIEKGNQTTQVKLGSSSLEAMQSIEFKVGSNSIAISQSGVTIKGLAVNIQGEIQVKMEAAVVDVNANGELTLKGTVVMIN